MAKTEQNWIGRGERPDGPMDARRPGEFWLLLPMDDTTAPKAVARRSASPDHSMVGPARVGIVPLTHDVKTDSSTPNEAAHRLRALLT